ncbi:MAG TPA: hypothetical protein VII63_12640 [Caulobacteraceae bacterium]
MKLVLAACAVALAAAAAAGPHDASIPAAVPTVGSEIHRGAAAAFVCYLRFSGLRQAADFTGCVQEAHTRNQQRVGEGYEAFDAGLYFRAAQFIRIKVEVLQQGDRGSDTADLLSALDALAADSHAAQTRLDISDSEVADVLAGQ